MRQSYVATFQALLPVQERSGTTSTVVYACCKLLRRVSSLPGLASAALIAVSGCGASPAEQSPPSTRAELAREAEKIRAVPLDCGGTGYTATYTAATRRHPDLIIVSFRGTAPAAATAEAALRECLTMVAGPKNVKSEVIATAWYSQSGQGDDYKTVPVPDGSSQLLYQPEGGRILTWKERWPQRGYD